MKKNLGRVAITVALLSMTMLLFAGVIRKDIPISEYEAYAKQPKFDCVGRLLYDGKFGGSVVYVGKNKVLTAAHVLVYRDDKSKFECEFNGRKVKVLSFKVHPKYEKNKLGHDIAILEIADTLKGIMVPEINADDKEFGKKVCGAGYGQLVIAGLLPSPTIMGEKFGGENIIDSVGGDIQPETGLKSMLYVDFDNPYDRSKDNFIGTGKPLRLEWTCVGGDSGSGLFYKQRQLKLIGLVCGSSHMKNPMGYGRVGMWTRVSAFRKWLDQEL